MPVRWMLFPKMFPCTLHLRALHVLAHSKSPWLAGTHSEFVHQLSRVGSIRVQSYFSMKANFFHHTLLIE